MNKDVDLSPIIELTDLDISYLINQLSSTSMEITDRTIEELLKDAEKLAIPTDCKNTTSSPGTEQLNNSPGTVSNVSSTNIFMTAIASLSEVASKIQSKLTEEKENMTETGNKCVKAAPIANSSEFPDPNINAKRSSTENRLISCRGNRLNRGATTLRVKSKPLNNNTGLARSTVEKAYPRPWRTASSNVLRAATIAGSAPGSIAASNSNRTITKRMIICGVDDNSSRSDNKSQVTKSTAFNTKAGTSRFRQDNSSDSCSQSGGLLRKLKDDNARLNLQVKKLQDQLSKSSSAARSRPAVVNARNVNKVRNPVSEKEVAPKIDEFQRQLAVIQTKYEAQLQSLTNKCRDLERELSLPKSAPPAEVQKSARTNPTYDRGCQTDKEKRDAGCQSDRLHDVNGGACVQPLKEVVLPDHQRNVPSSIPDTNHMPGINFEFHNLDMDGQFVPWQEISDENVPAEKSRKVLVEGKTRNFVRERKKTGKHGDQHLISTIRGLQVEVQTKDREIRRLKSEVEKAKSRPAERMKGVIRRSMGTQTIGLGNTYDPNLLQEQVTMSHKNENLKITIEVLESEIETLNRKRVEDLKMLQEKHEEEISALLEQKLFLANKLDALLARTFR